MPEPSAAKRLLKMIDDERDGFGADVTYCTFHTADLRAVLAEHARYKAALERIAGAHILAHAVMPARDALNPQ